MFQTPLLIVVLIGGTGFVLWRILRAGRGRPDGRGRRPDAPARRRAADLARLADERWDLLIVGGGIVGAGALLDAASRGLASRSSSRTTSRVGHLVALDAADPRRAALPPAGAGRTGARGTRRACTAPASRAAPRPPRDVPVPVVRAARAHPRVLHGRDDGVRRARLGAVGRAPPPPRRSRARWPGRPPLRRDGLRGGILYHDAMEDDARLTLAVVPHGAGAWRPLALTRVRARPARFSRATAWSGPGARRAHRRRPSTSGRTRCSTRPASGAPLPGSSVRRRLTWRAFSVLPSRGSHLVVPRERIPITGGMTLRIPGRVGVPRPVAAPLGHRHHRRAVSRPAGPPGGRSGRGRPDPRDAQRGARRDLTRDDVVGTYAGLRPLVAPSDATSTVAVSREHRVAVERPGLVRISGGKYTTYRVMARDAVDAVLGRRGPASGPA